MDTSMAKKVKFPIAAIFLFVMILMTFSQLIGNFSSVGYIEERIEDSWSESDREDWERELEFQKSVMLPENIKLAVLGILQICLAVCLCRKTNDIFLCATISLVLLFEFVEFSIFSKPLYYGYMGYIFIIRELFNFLKYIPLLFVSLLHCDYPVIKKRFGRFSEYSRFLVYVTVIIAVISSIFNGDSSSYVHHVIVAPAIIHHILLASVEISFFVLFAKWLVNPYVEEKLKLDAKEKIVIKGRQSKILSNLSRNAAIVIYAVLIFSFILTPMGCGYWYHDDYSDCFLSLLTFENHVFSSVIFYGIGGLALIVLIASFPIFIFSICEVIVTEKRVFGKARFGRRVDIPMDSISAVSSIDFAKGISVSSSSGIIAFSSISNYKEIHSAISELVMGRHNDKPAVVDESKSAAVPSDKTYIEELKDLKILLDGGIITPEEFDAKKKQILGL